MSETRVVLVKPGDVLVFGNVGEIADPELLAEQVAPLRNVLGLKQVVLFAEDIDMAAVEGGA